MDLRELLSFPSLGTPTRNPEGTPSIYASKEEWQAYRAKQAADVVAAARVTNAASDVRSVDNQIESDALIFFIMNHTSDLNSIFDDFQILNSS